MEIIERDGKFYLQLVNGELELSEEQVKARLQRGAIIRNNLNSWIENFEYRQWPLKIVPGKAEAFVNSDKYFDEVMMDLEHIYNASENKPRLAEKMIEFCSSQINKLKKEKETETQEINLAFLDYHILCWLRVLCFIQALTNSGYIDMF